MPWELTSTAFEDGQPIPLLYTVDGRDISPPLKWPDPPKGLRSFALVCEDPDAPRGLFTHWLVWNLPAASWELSEELPREPVLANGTMQGTNDAGNVGYNGPAPPPGKPHRYLFRLFGLDQPLKLPAGATRDQLFTALEGHVRAEAQLTGTYARGGSQNLPDDPLVKKELQDRIAIHTAPLS